jgi:hypothetical protein
MTKTTPALRKHVRPAHPGLRNEGPKRLRGKEGRARPLIRKSIEALRRERAPLDDLTTGQIIARCSKWMRGQGMLDSEIPSPRSFERHLPTILVEVLAGEENVSSLTMSSSS